MAGSSIIPPTPTDETYAVGEDQGEVFTHDDPFALFEEWLALAVKSEPNDANAMSLATVDADGLPDVRIILLKDISGSGLTFYTNKLSDKGAQLRANEQGALCFHWKTIRRQVRFRGPVEEVSDAESDAYFSERARGARIGAIASRQSSTMDARATLEAETKRLEAEFDGADIPRPDNWGGYRLIPSRIEFWVNRPFRLHDRLLFEQDGQGGWKTRLLYP